MLVSREGSVFRCCPAMLRCTVVVSIPNVSVCPAHCGPSQNCRPHSPRFPLAGTIRSISPASMVTVSSRVQAGCAIVEASVARQGPRPRRVHRVRHRSVRCFQCPGRWGQLRRAPQPEHGALLDRDRAEPLGWGRHVQGLVWAHGVVLDAPGVHRGLCGVQIVEGAVRVEQFTLDELPQLHRLRAFPPPVILPATLTRDRADQTMAHQHPIHQRSATSTTGTPPQTTSVTA